MKKRYFLKISLFLYCILSVFSYNACTAYAGTFPEYVNEHTAEVTVFAVLTVLITVTGIVVYFSNVSLNKMKLQEKQFMLLALVRPNISEYFIDVTTGLYTSVKMGDGIEWTDEPEGVWEKLIHDYLKKNVHPEDMLFAEEMLSLNFFRKEITKDNPETSFEVKTQYNGTYFWTRHVITYVDSLPDGRTYHVLLGVKNVDDVIKKEHEAQERLENALVEAQRANMAKTMFLNNVSHDIRPPLNAIIGFTTLAQSRVSQPEVVKDYLGKINVAGNHLLSLINDLLDMSRIESGKVKIEERESDLKLLIEDIRSILQADVDMKGQKLILDMETVRDTHIICDELRLKQILLNCMRNAIKFTGEGGTVGIRIEQNCEEADCGNGEAEFIFTVFDTGIGISAEFQKHIFEPFTRETSSTVSGIQGTGLGMAITKSLVDMMQGEIKIDSTEGVGTKFIISVKFRIGKENSKNEAEDAIKLNTDIFKDKKVLLVEDVELNREIAETILKEAGMQVVSVTNGQEAVEYVERADDDSIDLILMDVMMPVMGGYEAARLIRKIDSPKKSAVPIAAMTANVLSEDMKTAYEAGMNAYISKPIIIERLYEEMSRLLKK